ncbi:AcrR family transcriptional regulator [Crossiella equi]|uniref:AcrR family transcriptional regulator n=1 Tax=Crossiella equi TaxID=130796 RepID=A0ABS5ACC9_9PSEU|nr:TetR/AcrR family transcriptional regulator [Crossiella equi]MBP2474245.1 AcrR family transcriptional regulator [Crossiella equi]
MVVEETTGRRRRAPAMSVEARRAAIIRSTLPLLAEHGVKVSTSQIAKAAGIAEGTVFRAFADKRELLTACFEAALRVDDLVDQLTAIQVTGPLTTRLTAAATTVDTYFHRMGTVLSALATSGFHLDDAEQRKKKTDAEHLSHLRPVLKAVAGLLEPDAGRLRVRPVQAARYLIGLIVSSGLGGLPQKLTEPEIAEVVDVLVHGAFTTDIHSLGEGPQDR